MVVYFDVIFIINFVLDYIIAFSTSKATYIHTTKFRLILSSLLGGIYSIFMFEEKLNFFYSPFIKLIFPFVLIFTGFKINKIKNIFILIINYYIISFAVCGTGIFINCFFGVVKMENGLFYIKNNIILFIPAAIFTSAVIVSFLKILNRKNIKNLEKKEIEICIEGKKTTVTGIIDTGNLLLDPITLYPVIVVGYEAIKEILPAGLYEFLKEENDLSIPVNRKYMTKIRLVPYKTVETSSVLKGFKPDFVTFTDENKILSDVIIAVSYRELSQNNEFNAILNPQM